MGDVFDTRQEALASAAESNVPILGLTHIEMPVFESDELRSFMGQYLDLAPAGDVTGIEKMRLNY